MAETLQTSRAPGLLQCFATGPDAPLLESQAEIDRLYRRSRTAILTTIMLGYGFMYTCRLGLAPAKDALITGGLFSVEELGYIGSAFLYGYAIGRLVNGFLADHANLRRFFTLGVVLTACVNLLVGSHAGVYWWSVLWGLNGWFQGFGAPSCIVSITRWFSHRERGRVYGVWSVAHSIGEGLSFLAGARLVFWFGWRGAFIGPGLFCLLVAAGIYILMRDRPQTLGLPAIADWKNDPGVEPASCRSSEPGAPGEACPATGSQWAVLKIPALWIICLASATMYVTRYAVNSWGMFYLQQDKGYSILQAGTVLFWNTAAGVVGCIAYGWISDTIFRTRRPPLTLAYGILEVLALVVMFTVPAGHPLLLTAAFMLYGFTLSGLLAVLGGLFAVDIVPKHAAGAAIGLTGVFSYLGAAVQELVTAHLIGRTAVVHTVTSIGQDGVAVLTEVRHYNFTPAIIFWIGSSVVSLLLAVSLWRVRARE